MRPALVLALLMLVAAGARVAAQEAPEPLPAPCNGPTAVRTGPSGRPVTICLDRTYATCVRDGQRQGSSEAAARRFCNTNRNLTR